MNLLKSLFLHRYVTWSLCLVYCAWCSALLQPHAEPKVVPSSLSLPQNLLFDVQPHEAQHWELATVRFVQPLRHKRDLTSRDHHILQLERSTSTVQIHVSKKPTLVSPNLRILVRENANDETELNPEDLGATSDAVFHGEVISESNDSSVGIAALSACQNNTGLCGLIITDTEHLLIQPSNDQALNPEDGTLHAVFRLFVRVTYDKADVQSEVMTMSMSTVTRSEFLLNMPMTMKWGVHVPLEKLRAAAALAVAAHSQAHQSQDLEDTLSEMESTVESDNESHAEPTAYAGGRPKVRAMNINSKNVVEIAVFTDEDFYNQMKKRFPSDTVTKLTDYVITLVNAMDLMYQHPTLGEQLEFSLVHLEIMKRYPPNLNKNDGKAMKYLSSFCDYAGGKNINGDMWDHALLLTGMDLHEDDTTATAGLAWAGTMCYRYYSCSVSEGNSFGAAYIITHEIGHSLGMEHDGMGISKSCDMMKYLMSPTTGPGKVEWSSCSRQNLKDFLRYGTAELRNTRQANKPTCLSMSSLRSAKKIEISESNQLPGKKYNASMQCKLAMGTGFRPVLRKSEPPFDNICWMLYCGNGTHAVSSHPALEGTKCDDNKQCKSGKCVDKK